MSTKKVPRKDKCKFGAYNTDLFIKEVKKRPVIWNPKHPHHRYKLIYNQMWEEVRGTFYKYDGHKYTMAELKKKWKNLKDTYRKELRKFLNLQTYGQDIEDGGVALQPNWPYFAPLDFLRGVGISVAAEEADKTSSNNCEVLDDSSSDSEANTRSEVVSDNNEMSNAPCPASPLCSTSTTTTQPPAEKRLKSKLREDMHAEHLEIERKRLKLLEMEVHRRDNEEKSDNYHFLMSILPEMNKLPAMNKMRLRNKINQAVMEEMSQVRNDEPVYTNAADSQLDISEPNVNDEFVRKMSPKTVISSREMLFFE